VSWGEKEEKTGEEEKGLAVWRKTEKQITGLQNY